VRAIYGDAAQREILRTAGIERARGLVFSSNASPVETVKAAIELNPRIAVLTRTAYLREAPALRAVGATVVVAEAEVALAMTERLLARLGATAEQLDRARARVRSEIQGEIEREIEGEVRS
jgi:CPA2 family monovalent cation:H+ antiporter-2